MNTVLLMEEQSPRDKGVRNRSSSATRTLHATSAIGKDSKLPIANTFMFNHLYYLFHLLAFKYR